VEGEFDLGVCFVANGAAGTAAGNGRGHGVVVIE
jgi:hypothetical protein